MTELEKRQFKELLDFKRNLESSNTIPLSIDQSFRDRFALSRYKIYAVGTFTTLGGDAFESISITGVTPTDIAFVTLKTQGAGTRTIISAAADTNEVDVVLSGNPGTDHVISYLVIRPQ